MYPVLPFPERVPLYLELERPFLASGLWSLVERFPAQVPN
jgi:hypothetical protein